MASDMEKNQGQSGQYGQGQSGQTGQKGTQTGQPQQGNVDPNRKNPNQGTEQNEHQNRQSRG